MKCINPINAVYPIKGYIDTYTGELKRKLQFSPMLKYYHCSDFINGSLYYITKDSYDNDFPDYSDIKVPCGKCIGCYSNRCRDYTTRAVHEYYSNIEKNHKNSMFITLTFNEEMLRKRDVDNYKSVDRTEIKSFIKRLRRRVDYDFGEKFKVFGCAEYGSKHQRPHYHLLIYGFRFPDMYVEKQKMIAGKLIKYYRSPTLEEYWCPANSDKSYGFSIIGEVNQSTCQYVAHYLTSKIEDYEKNVYEKENLTKPFLITPRKEGLGLNYLKRNYEEIFNVGYCHWHNKIKAPIPSYYYEHLKDLDENLYRKCSIDKILNIVHNLYDSDKYSTRGDLLNYEQALKLKYEKCIRSYENSAFCRIDTN